MPHSQPLGGCGHAETRKSPARPWPWTVGHPGTPPLAGPYCVLPTSACMECFGSGLRPCHICGAIPPHPPPPPPPPATHTFTFFLANKRTHTHTLTCKHEQNPHSYSPTHPNPPHSAIPPTPQPPGTTDMQLAYTGVANTGQAPTFPLGTGSPWDAQPNECRQQLNISGGPGRVTSATRPCRCRRCARCCLCQDRSCS